MFVRRIGSSPLLHPDYQKGVVTYKMPVEVPLAAPLVPTPPAKVYQTTTHLWVVELTVFGYSDAFTYDIPTANTASVYIGFTKPDEEAPVMLSEIAPGQAYRCQIPNGFCVDLGDLYAISASAGQGLVIQYLEA